MTRFDARQAVQLIDTHRVTYVTSFPPVLTQLLDAAAQMGSTLASLKHVFGLEGPDVITRLHTQTSAQFWTGFGQTETSGFVTLQRAADHPGSAGKVAPLCQIRLVDEADRDVPVGTPGEILVRGPVVFQGYFDQPDVTAQTFRGGWHHTGDVGRFDADGYLYYVQRKPEKALIKPGVKTSIQRRWKQSSWSWRTSLVSVSSACQTPNGERPSRLWWRCLPRKGSRLLR